MPLIVGRQSAFGMERVRVFWLFVEVGRLINRYEKLIAPGKRHLIRELSTQGQRQPVINRTGVVLPLINAIELRRESRGGKHRPPNLLRKRIWNPEAGSVVGSQQEGSEKVHIASARKLYPARKQERCTRGQIICDQMLYSSTGNLAARGLQVWVGDEDRRTNRRSWTSGASTKFRLEDLDCRLPVGHLVKGLETILL